MTPPLCPGDRARVIDAWPHANYLRLGAVYTVDRVSADGRRVGLTTGPARMWSADQFALEEAPRAAQE